MTISSEGRDGGTQGSSWNHIHKHAQTLNEGEHTHTHEKKKSHKKKIASIQLVRKVIIGSDGMWKNDLHYIIYYMSTALPNKPLA